MSVSRTLRRPVPDRSLFLIIDVQERLAPAMHPPLREALLANVARLGAAAKALDVATVITEQYPKGLGPTLGEVTAAFEGVRAHAKLDFDVCADAPIAEAIAMQARETIVVAGMETHICVFQSVRSLLDRGHEVLVLRDAVASRTPENHAVGLALMERMGAVISSTEAVLFDLVGRAGTDAFKVISKLVR